MTFKIVRPPTFARQEQGGVTYLIGRDYEFVYQTVLRFASDAELPITAKLFGELNQQLVIRDTGGRTVQVNGYAQGRVEISDADGNPIFEGRYYDSRIAQALTGDDALTLTGTRTVDHWENGFGRGAFAGHPPDDIKSALCWVFHTDQITRTPRREIIAALTGGPFRVETLKEDGKEETPNSATVTRIRHGDWWALEEDYSVRQMFCFLRKD